MCVLPAKATKLESGVAPAQRAASVLEVATRRVEAGGVSHDNVTVLVVTGLGAVGAPAPGSAPGGG